MTELTIANIVSDTQLIIRMLRQLNKQNETMADIVKVLIAGGKMEEIGAYSYGRTKANDEFVLLFSSVKKLDHKICRVYKEQFHLLPWYIETHDVPLTAPVGNDTRTVLQRQGLLKQCAPFTIATRPGKETQMGTEVRFYIVIDAPQKPKLAKRDQAIAAEQAEVTTPDTTTALKNINNMFGLGETEPTHEANELFDNFLYRDETDVPNSDLTRAIFTTYYGIHHDVPENSTTLASWYTENKEMVDAKLNRNGDK